MYVDVLAFGIYELMDSPPLLFLWGKTVIVRLVYVKNRLYDNVFVFVSIGERFVCVYTFYNQ